MNEKWVVDSIHSLQEVQTEAGEYTEVRILPTPHARSHLPGGDDALPLASETAAGLVKIGEGLTISEDGTLSSEGGGGAAYFTITVTQSAGGVTNPSGEVRVAPYSDKVVTLEAADGYYLKDVLVDGSSVGRTKTYTFESIDADHTITPVFEKILVYGYTVNWATSSPTGCISYTDSSLSLTQEGRKAKTYSWVKPTVISEGEIAYDLDRTNLAKKADGTASKLDGTDGDVCASIQKLWLRFEPQSNGVYTRIVEHPMAGFMSVHQFNGIIREWLHIGMFEATGTTVNSVYSTTLKPTVSQSMATFRSQAQTKNTGLDEALYGIETFLTWTLYQTLFVHAYGTTNSQAAIGAGISEMSGSTYPTVPCTAAMLTCGGELIAANGSSPNMALFVANPFGSVWEFRDGCMWSDGSFALATDQADIYHIENGWSKKPTTWHLAASGCATNWSQSYITAGCNDAYAPFFPKTAGSGSSTTYACDAAWSATGDRVCLVGGGWVYAAFCGVFALTVRDAVGYSFAYLGARLQVLDKNPATL